MGQERLFRFFFGADAVRARLFKPWHLQADSRAKLETLLGDAGNDAEWAHVVGRTERVDGSSLHRRTLLPSMPVHAGNDVRRDGGEQAGIYRHLPLPKTPPPAILKAVPVGEYTVRLTRDEETQYPVHSDR